MSLLSAEEQKAAAEARGPLVPAGRYICRVKEIEKWTTGTSLCWKFRVAKGQPAYAGKEFWDWTGLADDAIWKTKAHLTALGFGLDADEKDVVGTPCFVFVEIKARSDTLEPANKVAKVALYEGPPLPEEDAEDIQTVEESIDRDFGFAEEDGGLI